MKHRPEDEEVLRELAQMSGAELFRYLDEQIERMKRGSKDVIPMRLVKAELIRREAMLTSIPRV